LNGRYAAWPLSVRTALFVAGQYLRRASIASDTRLFPDDYTRLSNSMTQAPFVTAFNVDETLFQRPTAKRTTAAQLLLGTAAARRP